MGVMGALLLVMSCHEKEVDGDFAVNKTQYAVAEDYHSG